MGSRYGVLSDRNAADVAISVDRYGHFQLSSFGRLRNAGIALLATFDHPPLHHRHDLSDLTVARLLRCFDSPGPNPGRQDEPGLMTPADYDVDVDFMDMRAGGRLWARGEDAKAGFFPIAGRHATVSGDDAEPAVAAGPLLLWMAFDAVLTDPARLVALLDEVDSAGLSLDRIDAVEPVIKSYSEATVRDLFTVPPVHPRTSLSEPHRTWRSGDVWDTGMCAGRAGTGKCERGRYHFEASQAAGYECSRWLLRG